jgi:GNAT superfamily N-acetyltransferase
MAVWSRVRFAYRSSGALGVGRAAARKALYPVASVETFVLMRAPLSGPLPRSPAPEGEVLRPGASVPLDAGGWPEGSAAIRRFERAGAEGRFFLTVAGEGQALVGVCLWEGNVIGLPGVLLRASVPSYFVHFIGVRDAHRGRGLAPGLLAASDAAAMAAGARYRLALVARHNAPSLRVFAKSGAEPAGVVRVIRALRRTWFSVPSWLAGSDSP